MVSSDTVKVYNVAIDAEDIVSRSPICNNVELFPILSSVDFPGKIQNQMIFEKKQKRKNSFSYRIKKKAKSLSTKILRDYKHTKTYTIIGK